MIAEKASQTSTKHRRSESLSWLDDVASKVTIVPIWWDGDETTGDLSGNYYTFTGRRSDPESELMYFRNRYYAAQLGRFVGRDASGYEDGMNLYAYARVNPLIYADFMGFQARHDKCCPCAEGNICSLHTPNVTTICGANVLFPSPPDPSAIVQTHEAFIGLALTIEITAPASYMQDVKDYCNLSVSARGISSEKEFIILSSGTAIHANQWEEPNRFSSAGWYIDDFVYFHHRWAGPPSPWDIWWEGKVSIDEAPSIQSTYSLYGFFAFPPTGKDVYSICTFTYPYSGI